jgi:hypothetical protein
MRRGAAGVTNGWRAMAGARGGGGGGMSENEERQRGHMTGPVEEGNPT